MTSPDKSCSDCCRLTKAGVLLGLARFDLHVTIALSLSSMTRGVRKSETQSKHHRYEPSSTRGVRNTEANRRHHGLVPLFSRVGSPTTSSSSPAHRVDSS